MSRLQSGFAEILLYVLLPISIFGQSAVNPKTETPTDSLPKIKFLPPKDVRIEVEEKQAKIMWTTIPLGRVQGYVVYKKTDGTDSWQKVGFTSKPPFLLHSLDSSIEYSVAALDISGTEGRKSKPVNATK